MNQEIKLRIGGDASDLVKTVTAAINQIQQAADKLKISPAVGKAMGADVGGGRVGAAGIASMAKTEGLLQQILSEIQRGNRQGFQAHSQQMTFQQIAANQRFTGVRPPIGGFPAAGVVGGSGVPGAPVTAAGTGGGGPGGIPMGIALPTSIMAGVYAAVKAGTAAYGIGTLFAEAANRARVAGATAFNMQGQGGQRLQSLFSGGAPEEVMFNMQRLQASQIAETTMQSRLESPFRKFVRPGEFLFGQYEQGKMGNSMGGAMGRLGGLIPRQLGLGTPEQQREYQEEQYKEKSAEQQEQYEAIRKGRENAIRTTVGDKYLRDWRRNLDFQRQAGQTEGGFRDFLGGVNRAGFTDETGMGMTSAIIGAGGSTRGATGNAGFALQMQRQFGLTNAGQAMGAVSGQLGGAQLSKEALIKIQAEGTRIGVNQADFVEENRRFVEMAANVINRSNVTSSSGIDQLVGTLGRFMGEKTVTGMEAGRSAYQAYQQQSNIQSGPSAVMRAAAMIKSPTLSRLGAEEQASLFTMNQADVNVDNLGIKAMANQLNIPAQDLVDEYHKAQNSSLFQRKSSDRAISNLRKQYSGMGPVRSGAAYANQPKAAELLEGEALNKMRLEESAKDLDEKGRLALARAQAGGDTAATSRIMREAEVSGKAEAGKTGRPGDETERLQAQSSRLANELFKSIQDSIVPTTATVREFTAAINELMTSMKGNKTQAQKASMFTSFINNWGMAPSNQPTAGTPANGPGTQ